MRRLRLLGLICAVVISGCGGADPTPEVDSSRIVTLSGDLTEFVYELGLGDNMVGVDVTTVAPAPALELPVVGVGRFITAEGVLGVDPTLVLADTQSSPAAALDQIGGAGVSVEVLDVATDFDALYDKIADLGALLGRTAEAEDLSERIRDEVAAVDIPQSINGLRIAYVYTRGPDVNLLFGEGMVTGPLIEAVGAVDAGAEVGVTGSVSVTAEQLVAAAPDVIIVPEEGLSILGGVDVFLELPGVAQTPAGRSGAILAYPEGDFLTFGPRVADSIERLVADLVELAG